MDDQLRIIPIHRSLVRPQLLMGCERFLMLMLCMVVTLLAGPGGIVSGNFFNIMLSGALFFGGRALLAHMAKIDPNMSDVFRRSARYLPAYPAIGTVGYRHTPNPKRW